MKYPIFLVSFFIFSACSFNSTIETRYSKVGDASRPADISSILEKKKFFDDLSILATRAFIEIISAATGVNLITEIVMLRLEK